MKIRTQSWTLVTGLFLSASLAACGAGSVGETSGDTGGNGTGGSQPGATGGSGSGPGTGGAGDATGGHSNGTGGRMGGSSTGGRATGGGATPGSGGAGSGNTGGSGTDGGVPPGGGNGLPCEVTSLLGKCTACHGAKPAGGAPSSLVTYADLIAPSKSDPSRSEAAMALVRMNSTASPMPPAGSAKPTAAEIAGMQAWVNGGMAMTTCGGGADGGTTDAGAGGTDAGSTTPDPLDSSARCTSNRTWTGGNQGSGDMNPGMACINCHSQGEGPRFAIAGTLYPTGHEPDRCNGSNGSTTGARVVITGADGKVTTLTPNSVGNFYTNTAVAKPFTVKVTYMGRTRAMAAAPANGDCNSCHTQNGASSAPGRITLP
jgi:hypothetical protein